MHFCMDELRMIALAIPFVGLGILCVRNIWHRIWHKGSPKSDGCCDKHDH